MTSQFPCHRSVLTSPFIPSQLYENFVEEVDAVDNGISQYDGEARYSVSSTLSARVGHLNPRWNSKSQDTEVGGRAQQTLFIMHLLNRRSQAFNVCGPVRGSFTLKGFAKNVTGRTPYKYFLFLK